MKKKVYIYIILTCSCIFKNLIAEHVITFFLRPSTPDAQVLIEKLKKPGKIAKEKLKTLSVSPLVKGLFATYYGYVDMSNNDGQITFPRKHHLPLFYMLVTNKITPVMMAGQTIHHWEIEEGTPAKMYKIERLHDEGEEIYYWLVQEVPLPENNRLPIESITILAKPKNVVLQEGATLTDDAPNLVLPDIFVKKGIKINSNALYILNLRQFFGQLRPLYKKEVARYLTQIQE